MIELKQQQFYEVIGHSDKPVLVEFWAPWCVYCRRIGPAMEKVAERFADRLTVGQVNIDEVPELEDAERIEVIPTLVLYRNGQPLGSIVAPESRARIEAFIQEHLNG